MKRIGCQEYITHLKSKPCKQKELQVKNVKVEKVFPKQSLDIYVKKIVLQKPVDFFTIHVYSTDKKESCGFDMTDQRLVLNADFLIPRNHSFLIEMYPVSNQKLVFFYSEQDNFNYGLFYQSFLQVEKMTCFKKYYYEPQYFPILSQYPSLSVSASFEGDKCLFPVKNCILQSLILRDENEQVRKVIMGFEHECTQINLLKNEWKKDDYQDHQVGLVFPSPLWIVNIWDCSFFVRLYDANHKLIENNEIPFLQLVGKTIPESTLQGMKKIQSNLFQGSLCKVEYKPFYFEQIT